MYGARSSNSERAHHHTWVHRFRAIFLNHYAHNTNTMTHFSRRLSENVQFNYDQKRSCTVYCTNRGLPFDIRVWMHAILNSIHLQYKLVRSGGDTSMHVSLKYNADLWRACLLSATTVASVQCPYIGKFSVTSGHKTCQVDVHSGCGNVSHMSIVSSCVPHPGKSRHAPFNLIPSR